MDRKSFQVRYHGDKSQSEESSRRETDGPTDRPRDPRTDAPKGVKYGKASRNRAAG